MCFGQIFAQSAFYYSHIQSYSNEPRALLEHENGYLVIGFNSLGGPQGNGFLMMIDKQGNILWENIEDAPEPDGYEMYTAGTFHKGYFYVGGYRWINNQRRNLMLKVNPSDGNIVWKKVFGELSVLGGDNHIQDMHPNEDGILIACSGFDSVSMSTDAELIQVDVEANVLWNKYYGADTDSVVHSDRLHRIHPMKDGYLLIMHSNNQLVSYGLRYIIKLDQQYNEVWRKRMDNYQSVSTGQDTLLWFSSATPYKGNNIISQFVIDNNTDSTYSQNIVIIEFDENGNEIDYKKFDANEEGIGLSKIFVNNKNELFILGNQEVSPPYYSQLYAAKFDESKNLIWEHHYGEEDIAEFYFCGTLTSDGGVLIGGRDLHFEFNAPRFNTILVKTDCKGSIEWNYESCISTDLDEVNIFPNPFSNYINIHIPNLPEKSEIKIKLYDTAGKLVDNLFFYNTEVIKLNTYNYEHGVYHCIIEVNGVVIAKKKIVQA